MLIIIHYFLGGSRRDRETILDLIYMHNIAFLFNVTRHTDKYKLSFF